MMIFDLSNPRTVDERVATIRGVKLINMDQIAEPCRQEYALPHEGGQFCREADKRRNEII